MRREEAQPPIDEEAWQRLGELPQEPKGGKPGEESKEQLAVEDDPNTEKLKQLIKVLANHIQNDEPEACPGIVAHATGMLTGFRRGSKKPEVKAAPKKEEEKKADAKEE